MSIEALTAVTAAVGAAASVVDTILKRIESLKIGGVIVNNSNLRLDPRITAIRKWGGIEGQFEDSPEFAESQGADSFVVRQIGFTDLCGCIVYSGKLDGVHVIDFMVGWKRSATIIMTSSYVCAPNTFSQSIVNEGDIKNGFWTTYVDVQDSTRVGWDGSTSIGVGYDAGVHGVVSTSATSAEQATYRLSGDASLAPGFKPAARPLSKPAASPLSSNGDLSGEHQIKVKADNRLWHCDGNSERKLVSTQWQPSDDFTRFVLEKQSDGSYRIKVKADNRYLHVDGSQPDQALNTQWQPPASDQFTRFIFEPNSDGSYRIKVKASNRYLHEDGSTKAKPLSTKFQPGEQDVNTHFFLV